MHVHYRDKQEVELKNTSLFVHLFVLYQLLLLIMHLVVSINNCLIKLLSNYTTHHPPFSHHGLSPRPLQSYIWTLNFQSFQSITPLFPSKQFLLTFSACSGLTTLVNLGTPSHCSSSYTLLTCRLPTVTHNVVTEGIQILFCCLPMSPTDPSKLPPNSSHAHYITHLTLPTFHFIFPSSSRVCTFPLIKPYSQDTPPSTVTCCPHNHGLTFLHIKAELLLLQLHSQYLQYLLLEFWRFHQQYKVTTVVQPRTQALVGRRELGCEAKQWSYQYFLFFTPWPSSLPFPCGKEQALLRHLSTLKLVHMLTDCTTSYCLCIMIQTLNILMNFCQLLLNLLNIQFAVRGFSNKPPKFFFFYLHNKSKSKDRITTRDKIC